VVGGQWLVWAENETHRQFVFFRKIFKRKMSKGPQTIGNVLAELMARRGFGRVQSAANYESAWLEAAGSVMAKYTRVGQLRRGVLEVVVANSTLMQELGFQKPALLESLAKLLPDEGIKNLKFRAGNLE
jgi:predicted nucleic acid-binding Zn ribbon protein